VEKMGNEASLFPNIILVFSLMKIGKADLRLKLKNYGNEATLVFSLMKIGKADLRLKLKKYGNKARLVFSSMKIGKDDIRLKWKKWEMFVLCIFIYENRLS
jgi:hypothetical protein